MYEWMPKKCNVCKNFGLEKECRLQKPKQVWQQKKGPTQEPTTPPNAVAVNHTPIAKERTTPHLDPDGFHKALKLIKIRANNTTSTNTENSFHFLIQEAANKEIDQVNSAEEGVIIELGKGTFPI